MFDHPGHPEEGAKKSSFFFVSRVCITCISCCFTAVLSDVFTGSVH